MLNKLLHTWRLRRHFWREATFSELSELYITQVFHSLAINIVGIFVPIFLLKQGYPLPAILAFFALFFTFRAFWDLVSGYYIARYGPKHAILASHIFQVLMLAGFTTLPNFHWPLLPLAALWGGANSFYFMALHVDFSKVKHSVSGGKEIGLSNAMDRIGATLGPLAGGLIASYLGAQYAFLAATVFFAAGLVPLFFTKEPVRIRQKLDFKGFTYRTVRRDRITYNALGLENTICLIMWPLFVALYVLSGRIYAQVGVAVAVAVAMSVLATRVIGRLIDGRQGRLLLRSSLATNTGVHLLRPFTLGFVPLLGVNIANEAATVGYRLPYLKGMYDAVEDYPGHRIVYFVYMEGSSSILKALMYGAFYAASLAVAPKPVLTAAFVLGAAFSGVVAFERFRALRPAEAAHA